MTGRLRVGIDTRALDGASGRRGVGAYIRGLLSGLREEAPASGTDIMLFRGGRERPGEPSPGFEVVRLSRPRRGITLWDQIAWPPLLARRGVRVFHSPFYAVPYFRPPGCRIVQTVHDLTPLRLPGCVSRHNARIFRANFRLARGADRIIVPSSATRSDVLALLRVDPERVVVIPEASDITPAEIETADRALPEALSRLGLGRRRYLLHTGGHDIVKNLPGLLQAFALLIGRGRDLSLVIAGEHGPASGAVIGRAGMLGLSDRVSLPGFLPREALIALYRGAAALVYPSFTEGFGLPVMEAMACGTPVVAADAGALPEVAGDACLLVPPSEPDAIAAAVESILDDQGLSGRLSARGVARAARFSWRETARRTLVAYREVAS